MDLSFAAQALATEWLVAERGQLAVVVHPLPGELDDRIAQLKLHALGVRIDAVSARQREYVASWREGT